MEDGLIRIEHKVDAMTAMLAGLTDMVGGIDTRLTTLEQKFAGMDDLIATKVRKEVERANKGVCDDICLLEQKADEAREQLDAIKANQELESNLDCIVMIRNMRPVNQDEDLLDDVLSLFGE